MLNFTSSRASHLFARAWMRSLRSPGTRKKASSPSDRLKRMTIAARAASRSRSPVKVGDAPARFATGPGPDPAVVTYAVDLDPVDVREYRLFHKTTDRSVYDARRRRHPHANEVILTNDEGRITEGSVTNVAVLIDGRWATPPVEDGLLPGVMRRALLEMGTLEERSISLRELVEADAVAVFNSVQGWRAAVPVDAASG